MPASSDSQKDASVELVRAAQAGDREALERLLARHLPGLRAFVRLQADDALRDKESCSDLVQSACLEAIQKLDHFEYRDEGSFRHWLYRTALNKLIDHQRFFRAHKRDARREARDQSSLADCYATLCTPSAEAIGREQLARLEAACDALPEHYREVLMLSRIVGLPHAEIARQLGKTEESVKSVLRRALVRLAAALDST